MTTVTATSPAVITATVTSETSATVTVSSPAAVSVSIVQGGITDAPADDGIYGRMNNVWKDIIVISATEPATMNSKLMWVDTA